MKRLIVAGGEGGKVNWYREWIWPRSGLDWPSDPCLACMTAFSAESLHLWFILFHLRDFIVSLLCF